jgi:outer membrane protein assembly factor BamB
MKKTKILTWLFMGALLLALISSPAVTQAASEESNVSADSQLASAWPMYRHDPQRSGCSEYRGPASEIKVKWKASQTSSVAITSLLIGNNRDIYVANTYGNLMMFDYATGSSKRQYNSTLRGSPIILKNGSVVATDGKQTVVSMQNTELYNWKYTFDDKRYINTSPVTGTDRAVFIHAPNGKLFAMDANTGSKIWEAEVYGDTTPAIGQNGTIYTLSAANVNHGEAGYLYAVNLDTGKLEWKLHLSDQNMGQCALAVGEDGTIYVSSKGEDNRLYAVNPDGSLKFKISLDSNLTPPAIAKNGTIYVGSEKGILYAFNNDGSKKWQFEPKTPITVAPVIGADGTVYACAGTMIFALDSKKSDVLWRYNAEENITTEPIIDSKGNIYIAAYHKVIVLYSQAPYAPYDLTVSSDLLNNLSLTWRQDTAYEEDGFIIEQRIGKQDFVQIGETARDVTTYKLSSVPSGQYTYRVKAYNKAGYSQYSNEAIIDLTDKSNNGVKKVHTVRFFIGRPIYSIGSAAYTTDAAPVVIGGRAFLPIRYVADALDAEVEWLEEQKQINIYRDNLTVSMWIDKPWATVNGETKFIDPQSQKIRPIIVPPGRIMLPIRFIAECLDCQVEWDEQTKEIKIVYLD